MDNQTLSMLTIPLFTGGIGYVTNWTGVWMLFFPIRFHGIQVPGLKGVANILPRRIQQIPGIMDGGLGWQGIVPSRAAKLGSIATDKVIAKVGSAGDFYREMDAEQISEHILVNARGDIRQAVERILEREHPQLWHDLPPRLREAVHARVQEQLPDIIHRITEEIGGNIDQILDIQLMVVRHLERNPELANRIFLEVGRRELRFIINFGFFFGFLLGVPTAYLTVEVLTMWWLLPIAGVIIGYVTNLVGIWMVFEPVVPRRLGPFTIQGLFLKRQPEVSEVYADIISGEIVTMGNMGNEFLHGPSGDRARQMIEAALRPAVDNAVGRARRAVRVAVGSREYDAIRESVAGEAVDYAMTPLADPEFNETQQAAIRRLFVGKMREMGPRDFSELLRTAIREDEWLLYLHGAALGLIAGLVHLAVFR
jgi:uncharacterized membrane protein YheB (UPF0754 family)